MHFPELFFHLYIPRIVLTKITSKREVLYKIEQSWNILDAREKKMHKENSKYEHNDGKRIKVFNVGLS